MFMGINKPSLAHTINLCKPIPNSRGTFIYAEEYKQNA